MQWFPIFFPLNLNNIIFYEYGKETILFVGINFFFSVANGFFVSLVSGLNSGAVASLLINFEFLYLVVWVENIVIGSLLRLHTSYITMIFCLRCY